MGRIDIAEHLLGVIYDTALDSSRLGSLLDEFILATGAHAGFMRAHEGSNIYLYQTRNYDPIPSSDLPHFLEIDYSAHYLTKVPPRVVSATQDEIPDSVILNSEAYNDYLRSRGLFYALGFDLVREDNKMHRLAFQRPRESGGFTREAIDLMTILVPHLVRSMEFTKEFGRVGSERQMATMVMEQSPYGIAVLDNNGYVVHVNSQAEKILREEDGLGIRSRRLVAGLANEDNALSSLIGQVLLSAREMGHHPGGVVRISRQRSHLPYVLRIFPIVDRHGMTGWDIRSMHIMVQISSSSIATVPCETMLRQLYSLTSREASVAMALSSGQSIEEYSDLNQVSTQTVRSHLKSIYQKMEIQRMTDMVRKVLSLPAKFD